MTTSKVISGERAASAKTWSIPSVDKPSKETVTTYNEGLASVCSQVPTLKDIEDLQKRAYDESYQTGYEEGKKKAEFELKEKLGSAQTLLDELTEPVKLIDTEVKQQLVQLALAVAKQIAKSEISVNPEKLLKLIEHGVMSLPESPINVYVHLNPEDLSALKPVLEANKKSRAWSIVEDVALARGGCKLYTENSSVDLSIDAQIAKIASRFLDIDSDEGDEIEELSI